MRKFAFILSITVLMFVPLLVKAQLGFDFLGENSGSDLVVTPQENDAYQAYKDFKNVKARQLIDEVLKTNPKSPVAYFVLALLTREGEGNSAQALHYINKAIDYAEVTCGPAPTTTNCVMWHGFSLQEKVNTLISLDRIAEARIVVDRFNVIYDPDLEDQLTWIAIKQKKLDEAEVLATKLAGKSDAYMRVNGLNNLCVIASERNLRREADRVCAKGADETDSKVLDYNTMIAKFSTFDYRGVEAYGRSGLKETDDLSGSLWEMLLHLYTFEGRFSEAVSAAKQAADTYRSMSAQDQENNRAHFLKAIAQLLLLLGRHDEALLMADEAHASPDRTGNVSGDPLLHEMIALDFYDGVLRGAERHLAERSRLALWSEKPALFFKRLEMSFNRFLTHRRLQRLFSKGDLLAKLVTPYAPSQGPVEALPHWMQAATIEAAGNGPFLAAVAEAQARDNEISVVTDAFYDSLRMQAALMRGDLDTAKILAEKCLKDLPSEEGLLRDMARTVLAASAWDRGETKTAKGYFVDLIKNTPAFLRWFDLRLPVVITTSGGDAASEAEADLNGSTRFEVGDVGLKLVIKETGKALSLCLRDDYDSDLHCTTREIKNDDPDKTVAVAVEKFQTDLFSPKIDLSQLDVSTLNGAPVRASGSKQLDELLKLNPKTMDLNPEPKAPGE